jgi:hypothetical protein
MNVAVSEPGLAHAFLQDFEQDLARSRRLDPAAWARRPALDKMRERFWSYFGELF